VLPRRCEGIVGQQCRGWTFWANARAAGATRAAMLGRGWGVGAIGEERTRGFFQKWEGPGQRKCQRQHHQQGTYYTDACCHHTATAAERAAAPSSCNVNHRNATPSPSTRTSRSRQTVYIVQSPVISPPSFLGLQSSRCV